MEKVQRNIWEKQWKRFIKFEIEGGVNTVVNGTLFMLYEQKILRK